MTKPKIAIIIGSTRPNRVADKPAQWLYEQAQQRPDFDAELVDLRDYDLPFFEERASNAWVPTQSEEGLRWQRKIAEFDGYIFLTPEYNHAPPGVLKNALDYAYVEWNRKPAAFFGYGSVGGARAVEQLRLIVNELQMAPVRAALHLQGADFMAVSKGQKTLAELGYMEPLAQSMFDDLMWWTRALKAAREQRPGQKDTPEEAELVSR